MSNPIRVGLVGLGRAGWGMHLSELEGKEDKFRIVAACDRIPERNELVKKRCACRTYGSIEELIADPEVELVDIATRSCDHYEHACMALAVGKDVLLEKPAGTSYQQFLDLLTRANRKGLPRLYFRQNRRFETAFQEVLSIIKSGILGNVFEVQLSEFEYQRRDDWQTLSKFGGGQILNWGPHLIDHALRFLDAPISRVDSNLILGAAGGDCEDHFSIYITSENGRYATVSVSGSAALNGERRYSAYGSRGALQMVNNRIKLRYIDPNQKLPEVVSDPGTPANEFGATGTFKAANGPIWIEEERVAPEEDLSVFWGYLFDSYRNGKPFPIKDEEVKELMWTISKAKERRIVKACAIR
ncbi:MAG TPA: Gfo/Idh/MocA family oxidoreductase [Clostridia bacterium]|nr:Gfo/Idh/MocA family oxidoreductase [Clostridia bacterium]